MATTNPLKEYWRNKWNQAADHSKATDTSKLFRVPKQEEKTRKVNNLIYNNEWGMYIGSDDNYKLKVINALRKIKKTGLGNYILKQLYASNNTQKHLIISIVPSNFTEYFTVGGNGYDFTKREILFSGETMIAEIFSDAYNADFTNLGHELWHAYEHNVEKNNYSEIKKTKQGVLKLEKGSVGFENYLCSVFGIHHLREKYNGETLWENPIHEFFNPAGENISLVLVQNLQTMDRTNIGNPIYTELYKIEKKDFDFSQIMYW